MEGPLAHPLPRDATLHLLEPMCAFGRSPGEREKQLQVRVLEPDARERALSQTTLSLYWFRYIYIYIYICIGTPAGDRRQKPQWATGGRRQHHLSKEECRNVAHLAGSFVGWYRWLAFALCVPRLGNPMREREAPTMDASTRTTS